MTENVKFAQVLGNHWYDCILLLVNNLQEKTSVLKCIFGPSFSFVDRVGYNLSNYL